VPLSDFPVRWPELAPAYAESVFAEAEGGTLLFLLDEVFARLPVGQRTAIIDAIPPAVERFPNVVALFTGEQHRTNPLFRDRADLAGSFAEYLQLGDYTGSQLMRLAVRHLAARGYAVSEAALDGLIDHFEAAPPRTGAREAHRFAGELAAVAGSRTIELSDLLAAVPDGADGADGPDADRDRRAELVRP
jgi:hypothetical protein